MVGGVGGCSFIVGIYGGRGTVLLLGRVVGGLGGKGRRGRGGDDGRGGLERRSLRLINRRKNRKEIHGIPLGIVNAPIAGVILKLFDQLRELLELCRGQGGE